MENSRTCYDRLWAKHTLCMTYLTVNTYPHGQNHEVIQTGADSKDDEGH